MRQHFKPAIKLTGLIIASLLVAAPSSLLAQPANAKKPWQQSMPPLDRSLPDGKLSVTELNQLIDAGEFLFSRKFNLRDGAGRPNATTAIIPTHTRRKPQNMFNRVSGMDANSCASCHNDPIIGGAGDFTTNVFVSEGFTNVDFDSTDPEYSNERNTNHLMGAGLVELLAREMTNELQEIRTDALRKARKSGDKVSLELNTKGVNFGHITANHNGVVDLSKVEGIDADLVIRPFSQKGVMTSLRQFTVNALNQHHGMQADERFGQRWTGENDFDGDAISQEITPYQVSALVAWQASLPPPSVLKPKNQVWQQFATKGNSTFDQIGCNQCHLKSLALNSLSFADPGTMDAAGTLRAGEETANAIYDLSLLAWAKKLKKNAQGQYLIPLFGDLKRHAITDAQNTALGNELLSQRFVERGEFMTSELWGIASTAPYGHRGDFLSLESIILAHGGDAQTSRDLFKALNQENKDAVIAYLKTLEITK